MSPPLPDTTETATAGWAAGDADDAVADAGEGGGGVGGRDDVAAAAAANDDAVDIGGAVLLRRPPELGLRK